VTNSGSRTYHSSYMLSWAMHLRFWHVTVSLVAEEDCTYAVSIFAACARGLTQGEVILILEQGKAVQEGSSTDSPQPNQA